MCAIIWGWGLYWSSVFSHWVTLAGTLPRMSSRERTDCGMDIDSCLMPKSPESEIQAKLFADMSQGQISAQGILHLRNPNLGPNSAKRILDARISDPNSWVEFFGPIFFQEKRPPEKFTVEKFTSQNSPSKIQPRNRAKNSHCTSAGPLG